MGKVLINKKDTTLPLQIQCEILLIIPPTMKFPGHHRYHIKYMLYTDYVFMDFLLFIEIIVFVLEAVPFMHMLSLPLQLPSL